MENEELRDASPPTSNEAPTVGEILRGTEYALTLFHPQEVAALALFQKKGKTYLHCEVTQRPRLAKPEEIVRQLFLRRLMTGYGYPRARIALEKKVYFGSSVHEKAADIVVWEAETTDTPYIIVECKRPKRKSGLEQLKSYCNAEGSPIGVWTNGSETIYLHREEPNLFRNLDGIPKANQSLSDMLNQPWTLGDLERDNIPRAGAYKPKGYNPRHGRPCTRQCRRRRI